MIWQDARATPGVPQLFLHAAALLDGSAEADDGPAGLLRQLDYLDGAAANAGHRACLLRAAAGFGRIFTIPSADAPGLVALGAEVAVPGFPAASVSGTGLTFGRAFESCVGEGIEHLSQYLRPADPILTLDPRDALAGAGDRLRALWGELQPHRRDGSQPPAWTWAASLDDGSPTLLPADLCFRRLEAERDLDPPWPLGTGCGAAPDRLSATLHGLLELIERDAVARWWQGDHPGRAMPPGPGAQVLAALRRGSPGRMSWLLDISGPLGVPVVVAASCERSGRGLCCGFAARATLAAAADAAAMEMAQMELGHQLSAQKRALRGEAALNAGDRRHIARFGTVDVARCPPLQPAAPPLPPADLPGEDPHVLLAMLRRRLADAGLATYALDLTRPEYGVPVVRVLCPGLEPGRPGTAP